MAIETFGDKTQDKRKIPENLEKIAIKLETFRKNESYSWSKLAEYIYDRIEEDEELENKYSLSECVDDKEDESKKIFAYALKKAIERKQENTTLNGKKISLKTICKLLGLDYKRENEEQLPHKEIYIQVNTDILYEKTIPWKEWFIPALEEVETSVKQGHKEAQTLLGHFYYYYDENRTRKDIKTALELYQSAAKQGDYLASYQLGLIYEYGNKEGDIEADEDKSYKYYKDSAEKNFPLALNKLAYYHYAKKEWKDFFTCAKKAKEQGDVIGTLYLAHAYQEGLGTNENIKEAISLYQNLTGNEEAVLYRLEILWTLVILHKKLDTSAGQNDSKLYFNKFFNFWKQGIEKALDDNNVDFFNQFFNTNPDRYNRILAAAHYDYVHNPRKPTVFSALFGFDKNTNP